MDVLNQAVFWIAVAQCPAVYQLVNWASRGLGDTEVALFRPLVAIVAGAAILALPLWAVGQLPMHGDAAPRAWFFGFLFGVVPLAVIQRTRRMRDRREASVGTPGRCPYCGHLPGYWNILTRPAARPFPCAACGKHVTTDPARFIIYEGAIILPVAVHVVGWGAPTDIPWWVAVLWIVFALPYPFIAKVKAAEDGI